jgi:hypothetical protein
MTCSDIAFGIAVFLESRLHAELDRHRGRCVERVRVHAVQQSSSVGSSCAVLKTGTLVASAKDVPPTVTEYKYCASTVYRQRLSGTAANRQ